MDNHDGSLVNPLSMRGLAFVELTTPRPDDLAAVLHALGFSKTMRHRTLAVDTWVQRAMQIFVNREDDGFAARFRAQHGPSVCALGLSFDDPAAAYAEAVRRGARPYGHARGLSFDAPAIHGVGDSLVYFVGAKSGVRRELVSLDRPEHVAEKGFYAIDHLTNNVEKGELGRWADFYKGVLGFTEVRSFDIAGQKTGLYSYALRSPCGTFSIPINEDKDERGQIAEYLREYKGAGVQHIALATRDVLGSLDAMNGALPMLDIDPSYYDEAFQRCPNVREDRDRIRGHQVLVDGDADGYLLQIFTKNVIGPIFFELIQRENHLSFGEGNFSALFRSLERDQERRGVL
jgi:4-hydroxyphenylpyruvate dioxygenase